MVGDNIVMLFKVCSNEKFLSMDRVVGKDWGGVRGFPRDCSVNIVNKLLYGFVVFFTQNTVIHKQLQTVVTKAEKNPSSAKAHCINFHCGCLSTATTLVRVKLPHFTQK